MSNKIAIEALKSELRESAITMANLPTEFGVACLTEAGAQRIAKDLTDAATALEAMEPVACLVNADLGAMVWPISDINEAETYCDEGEFPEPLYSATTVSALQARIATQAEHQAKALEGVQAFEFDPPPYHSEAMGCGLEDRGIRDRYEAMAYGWDEAMDRAYESIPDDLVSATTVSALQARIAELESELRRVTTSPPTGSAPCARLCEHMAFQIQAKSDARRIAELEQDAARYRWLRANVEPVFARKHSEEFHDLNMKWQIKAYLTAVTAVGGDVPFDESIDAARKESK